MQSIANAKDERISKDRIKNLRGTICLPLETLRFTCSHPPDPHHIVKNALKEEFKKGCFRLPPSNHIPAIITHDDLSYILRELGLSTEELLTRDLPPKPLLCSEYRLECLQGCHRVAAAEEVLESSERWWTVDLYSEDTGPELRTALIEEYSTPIKYSDSHIYTMICICRREGGVRGFAAEERWWSLLSPNKKKDLERFLKYQKLAAQFNDIHIIPGFWFGNWIGNLHEILAMRCDERVLHYFNHIYSTWLRILGGNVELMRLIDKATVDALELRAPSASRDDLIFLQRHFDDGVLFASITNANQRMQIWRNLTSIYGLIPTLRSFFEDVKFIRPIAKAMKRLLADYSRGESFEGTIDVAFTDRFCGENQTKGVLKLQRSDIEFTAVSGTAADQLRFGNLMLWLYSARHWPDLIKECPRTEKGEKKLTPREPQEVKWYVFALLARQLGYSSNRIRQMTSQTPSQE
ncbi:hypothetical protein K469DRAFT_590091, partial [Zopfia rhizophila CBS 207.26]